MGSLFKKKMIPESNSYAFLFVSLNLSHLFVSLVVTVVNSYPYGPEFKSRHLQKMESR